MVTVTVRLQDIRKLETEAVIAGFYENVRPLKDLAGEIDWLLCGSLSNLIIRHRLRGIVGDVALLTSQGKFPAQKIFLVGFGPKEASTPASIAEAARTAAASAVSAGLRAFAMECFPSASDMPFDTSIPALHRGICEGAGTEQLDVTILAPDAPGYETISRLIKN